MRFDLATLTRRQRNPRRSVIALRPIKPPATQASNLYRAAYAPIIAIWTEAIPAIVAEYERTLGQMTTDAPADVAVQIDQPERQANAIVITMRARLAEWAARLERWQRGRWRANVLSATGVDLGTMLGPEDMRETLEAVIERNVGLVRNINASARRRIESAVFNGLTTRKPAREVAREIREAIGIERRRALNIASNEATTLGAELNQERRRQAGIDSFEWVSSGKLRPREEHKARNGFLYSENPERQGQEYQGKRIRVPPDRTDRPGVPIHCGCTEKAVLVLEGETTAAPVTASPALAPTPSVRRPRRVLTPPPEPTPIAAAPTPQQGRGFRSPVNPNVTEATIRVEKRLALQKRMTADLADAAADPRYADAGKWRTRSERDFGRASFSTAWTDEAVSTVAAIKPELDDLADQIGIPRLRGFKTTAGSQNADMGGGVMALSPDEFNARTAKVGGGSANELAERARIEAESLLEQQRALRPRIETLGEQMIDARAAGDSLRFEQLRQQRDPLVKEYNSLYNKRRKMSVAAGRATRVSSTPQTKWRPGDDPKNKPWSVAEYYPEGIDRARSTLFHEFAHHVHQNLNRIGTYNRPLETKLRELWAETRSIPGHRDRLPSAYGHSNQHEWFAESFSLFVMGKKDLADPVLVDLIERIFRGEFK